MTNKESKVSKIPFEQGLSSFPRLAHSIDFVAYCFLISIYSKQPYLYQRYAEICNLTIKIFKQREGNKNKNR